MSITSANNNSRIGSSNASVARVTKQSAKTSGQLLFQQAVQNDNCEMLIKRQFDQSPDQQTELADEFIEAAGQSSIDQLRSFGRH